MTKRQIMEKIPFKLLAVFLLLAAGISAGGFIFYKQQRARSVAHIQEDLNTIAQLKSEEITTWRRERYGDAFVITRSQQFASSVRRWYKNTSDKKLSTYIYHRLDAFRIYETYKDVILVDPAGKARMFIDQGGSENLSQTTLSFVRESERQNRIIFSDFYFCEKCREVHLDVITPLYDAETNVGALILRINPDKYLYPLIQRWPSVSKSGETVLVRKEGNEIVYLNDLRHQKGAAMKLRLPLSDTLLPAAMAARGKEGMVEGLDYRGVPVVAAVIRIMDSPWYMVAKMDKEEIYAPLRRQAASIFFMVILTITLLAAVLSFIWQSDRRGFYKKQYQLEMEKQALVKHFDYLTKYANDIIFLLDQDRRIVEINDRGVEAYGYAREELLGREAGIVRAEEQREKFKVQMEELKDKGALLYETMHRKKDGTAFPVEISARTIEIEGKKYLQGIVRDISERKQYDLKLQYRNEELEATNQELIAAEEELKNQMVELEKSEKRYHSTLDNMMEGCQIIDREFRYIYINDAAARHGRKEISELLGKTMLEAYPGIENTEMFSAVKSCLKENKPRQLVNEFVYADGSKGFFDLSLQPVPEGLFILSMDITDRRKAEEELKSIQIRYAELFQGINSGVAVYQAFGEGEDFVFEDLNPAGQRMDDVSLDQVLGKKVTEVFPGVKPMGLFEVFQRVWRTGEPVHQPVSIYKDNRLERWRENYVYKLPSGEIVAVYDDLTEHMEAEIKIIESEQKFRQLAENIDMVFWLTDWTEKKLLYVNQAYEKVFGLTVESAYSDRMGWKAAVHPDDLEWVSDELQRHALNEEFTELEYRIICRGQTKWIHEQAFPLKDETGKVIRFINVADDITVRKLAEEKLRLKNITFDASIAANSIADNGGIINEANQAFLNIWGYQTKEEVLGKPILHFLQNEDEAKAIITALNNGGKWEGEYTAKRKDGTTFIAFGLATDIRDAENKLIGYQSAVLDITGRKQAERKVQQSEERLHSFIDNTFIGIYRTTSDGRILMSNPALVSMLGYASFEDLARRNLEQGNYTPGYERTVFKSLVEKDDKLIGYETLWKRKDGSEIWVRENARCIRGPDREVLFYEGTVEDITSRKLADEKIKAQLAELQRWQSTMLDREDRVRVLKVEVNRLLKELGRPEAYGPSA